MTMDGTPADLALPPGTPEQVLDFKGHTLEGWTTVSGRWAIEEMAGAPGGRKVLVQRATSRSVCHRASAGRFTLALASCRRPRS